MITLVRLGLLTLVRQPLAVGAFLAVPALLVLVTADAFDKFARVLGVMGSSAGEEHTNHFGVVSGIWAAGLAAAVVTAVFVSDTAEADGALRVAGAYPRWTWARVITFVVVDVIATVVAIGLVALRSGGTGWAVWLGALYVAIMYSMVAFCAATLSGDVVTSIAVIGSVWVLDAICAPSMVAGHWWQLLSPFYAPESLAMGTAPGAGELVALVMWPILVVVLSVAIASRRTRIAISLPPMPAGWGSAVRLRRGSGGTPLLLTDLARNGALVGFVTVGPLALMASSLWLFDGIDVAVPVVTASSTTVVSVGMPQLHAAYMSLIAVIGFSGTAGFLISLDLHDADTALGRRVGGRAVVGRLRLATLLSIAPVTTLCALVLTPLVHAPTQWFWSIATHIAAGWAFTLLGYFVGTVVDRATGIMVMLFLPFVDVGVAQDHMLGPELPDWAVLLPGYPFAKLALSSSFGDGPPSMVYVAVAAAIVLVMGVATALLVGAIRLPRQRVAA